MCTCAFEQQQAQLVQQMQAQQQLMQAHPQLQAQQQLMHGYGAAAALSTTGISMRFGSGHWFTSMMMAAFPPPSAATATPVTGLWRPWNFLAISAFIIGVETGKRKSASKPGYISGVGIATEVSVLEVESLTPPWYVIRWCSGSN